MADLREAQPGAGFLPQDPQARVGPWAEKWAAGGLGP